MTLTYVGTDDEHVRYQATWILQDLHFTSTIEKLTLQTEDTSTSTTQPQEEGGNRQIGASPFHPHPVHPSCGLHPESILRSEDIATI